MAGKQAKILSKTDEQELMLYAAATRYPARNTVIVLLSTRSGLRAGEIAKLTWDMVLTPSGEISHIVELHDTAAKKKSGRSIPIHVELQVALKNLLRTSSGQGAVVQSERGGPMTPNSIVLWFNLAYRTIGLAGCSSHSGRRTFITRAARMVHRAGGSLRDVQLLAGHRSIQTTQRYIDGDSDAQRKLVAML
ncbi:MAG: site-specific integrase [Bradyrhizobium sp.]|nr:site-specific integrase [Bradyrhizobium sp.]